MKPSSDPKAQLPLVLVIEDDPELPTVIEAALSGQALVIPARNWTDARERLHEETFDLILLDLFLPDVEALEPLEGIREIDPDYPVIVMSGNLDPGDAIVDRLMRLGVNTILAKPFDLEDLQGRILSVIGPPEPGSAREEHAW